jgi:predicted ATP-dependent protease
MEITNEKHIQIFVTIDKIIRTNETIKRYLSYEKSITNDAMIKQWTNIKEDLAQQLQDLLSQETEIKFLTAA